MNNLTYSIAINAAKEKVWHTMLDLDTYKRWTEPFYPGSYYEGDWEKGSDIKFVAKTDGKVSGIYGRVVENLPYEYVSTEYVGEIVDGQLDTETDEARSWAGAHENYRFTDNGDSTTVEVQITGEGVSAEMAKMFDESWPKALQKLKELCEA